MITKVVGKEIFETSEHANDSYNKGKNYGNDASHNSVAGKKRRGLAEIVFFAEENCYNVRPEK